MTSQAALKALTPEQLADLGELDELAASAAAVADLAQIDFDAADSAYQDAAEARNTARLALERAHERADEARDAAAALRAQAGVVLTASGYLTRDEAAARFGPAPQ